MAAFEVIALDTVTPQLRAPGTGDTYSMPRLLAITPETLTGSAATSGLSVTQTWNTTGTPSAFDISITDTASNASALLLRGRVGGADKFSVTKGGALTTAQGITTTSGTISSGDAGGLIAANSNAATLTGGTAPFLKGRSEFTIQWSSTGSYAGASDLILARDAANTLAQRNGVNAQAFNIYNTYTDASNYERGFVRWASNELRIGAEAAGTGTQRSLSLYVGAAPAMLLASGSCRFAMQGTNTDTAWFSGAMYPQNNNVTDMGTAASGWKNLFQTGFHEMTEQTAPAAPATNKVRVYAEDNGSGKTRLMALFATGAAQQIAIEP